MDSHHLIKSQKQVFFVAARKNKKQDVCFIKRCGGFPVCPAAANCAWNLFEFFSKCFHCRQLDEDPLKRSTGTFTRRVSVHVEPFRRSSRDLKAKLSTFQKFQTEASTVAVGCWWTSAAVCSAQCEGRTLWAERGGGRRCRREGWTSPRLLFDCLTHWPQWSLSLC